MKHVRWLACGLWLGQLACAGWVGSVPLGSHQGRVKSRFLGRPMSLVGAAMPQRPERVTVQSGDTLWALAKQYKVTVDALQQYNGMAKPRGLKVGEVLVLPPHAVKNTSRTVAAKKAAVRKQVKRHYPLRWPVQGALIARFGRKRGQPHDGIDIQAAHGAIVRASAAGEVVYAGKHGGYGRLVIVRHKGGLVTVYAHNHRNLVRKGQRVEAGAAVAEVGDPGTGDGAHLHFEVRRAAAPKNPLRYLPPD